MGLMAQALELLGWEFREIEVALDLNKHMEGSYVIKGRLNDWAVAHHLSLVQFDGYDAPKVWAFYFKSEENAVAALRALRQEVSEEHTIPQEVKVGRIYMTPHSLLKGRSWKGNTIDSWYFETEQVWLGVPGWRATSPSGESADISVPVLYSGRIASGSAHNIARLWTFLYKHGIAEAAKRFLEEANPEIVADAQRSKAERERVQRMRDALPEIEKVFRDITDAKYQMLVTWVYRQNLRQMEIFLKRQEEAGSSTSHKLWEGLNTFVLRLMLERGESYHAKWTPKNDYDAIAHREAEYTVSIARDAFIAKNTARISAIVKRKKNFKSAELLHLNEGHDYGGEIRFSFTDGSSFLLRNKTVWKQSALGRDFAQFPTTFHDVVMANGSKMPSPSEGRMLDVFAPV